MQKPRQYLLVGYPYSGKTTLAKELVRRLGFSHINLDELKWKRGYENVGDDDVPEEVWTEIFSEADSLLLKYLNEGKNVVNEYAWITKQWRNRARKVAKEAGYETRTIFIDVPTKEIWRRWEENKKTKGRFHWPREEFVRMFTEYEKLTPDEKDIVYKQSTPIDKWIKNNF